MTPLGDSRKFGMSAVLVLKCSSKSSVGLRSSLRGQTATGSVAVQIAGPVEQNCT